MYPLADITGSHLGDPGTYAVLSGTIAYLGDTGAYGALAGLSGQYADIAFLLTNREQYT